MNHDISIYLNSFLFKSSFFDGAVYFFAQIFPIMLLVFTVFYFFIFKKEYIKSLTLVGILSFSWGLSEVLKFIFSKPRPFLAISEVAPLFNFGSFDSFPSGHAMVFMSLATFMFYQDKKIGFLYFIIALIIGLARIFSGVHYFFDILAGFLFGWLVVFLAYKYLSKLRNK
jgi:undecaprenyl-diphosphatase